METSQIDTLNDIQVLENFISENEELEDLESIVNQFNIFTSLRIESSEIRHSNFLSWLTDPNETHGLGDYFLKLLIKRIARIANSFQIDTVSLIDIDYWDLENSEVFREEKYIDLLIKDDKNKFVCVIENKIKSTEHDNQLQRYFNHVISEFPDYKKMFVYLTVEGEIPESDSSNNWIPFSYSQIVETIDYLLKSKGNTLSNEIHIFISHYLEMLRRYIVEDSNVHKLCRRIYIKHKRAIDLIIEFKPDRLYDISNMLQDIIDNDADLILDISNKSRIRFIPTNLDFIRKDGSGWTNTKRILLFEIQNIESGVRLYLYIGPGDHDLRKKIFDIASSRKSIFMYAVDKLSAKWKTLYRKSLIKADKYETMDNEELKSFFEVRLQQLKDKDISNIVKEFVPFKNELGT